MQTNNAKSILQRINEHRSKQYQTVIDCLPWWAFIIIFGAYVAVVVIAILGSALSQINVYHIYERESIIENATMPMFRLRTTMLSNLNQEITTYLILRNNLYVDPKNSSLDSFGFTKSDLKIRLKLEGQTSDNKFETITADTNTYTKNLKCDRFSEFCSPVLISYQSYISHAYFQYTISLDNIEPLITSGLIDQRIVKLRFEMMTAEYSQFSIGWRYALLVITIPIAIMAFLVLLIRQSFKNWLGEQVWVLILAIVMTLYNNPLYILIYTTPSWIFPFLNIVFIATFFCFLMLTVLILTHSIIKRREDRSFIWFYLPKFILIGAIWLFIIIVFTYVKIQEKEDPTFDFADATTAYFTLALIAIIVIVIYIVILGFYLFRAFILLVQRKLPPRFSSRFRVVWIFTLLVLIATVVDVLVYLFARVWNNPAQFLSYFIIYNMYTLLMIFFYLPTFRSISNEELKQEEEKMLAHDEEALLDDNAAYDT